MNNIIEQMYKECGIEPIVKTDVKFPTKNLNYSVDVKYPPFTVEKQIELIKLLSSVSPLVIYYDIENKQFQLEQGKACILGNQLEEVIAQRIIDNKNRIDNSKIKGILQSE